MGYRIVYEGGELHRNPNRINWYRVVAYSCVCLLLFYLLTAAFWPEGVQSLEGWIYPGNVSITKNALKTMSMQIQSGERISDAVTAFCREIINGAQIPG